MLLTEHREHVWPAKECFAQIPVGGVQGLRHNFGQAVGDVVVEAKVGVDIHRQSSIITPTSEVICEETGLEKLEVNTHWGERGRPL